MLNISAMPAGVWLTQVVPPSVVATNSPEELEEFPKPPTAKHVVAEGHETAFNSDTPLGKVPLTHVAPPSVVATAEPCPTATQLLVDAHEMESSSVDGTDWAFQVTPPSVVSTIMSVPPPKPSAKHVIAEGHEMEPNEPTAATV